MRVTFLLLTAALGGTMALACREPHETVIVYIEPKRDASSALTEELAPDEADIPCAPRHVLQTICQRCHTRPMKNGAPFPLINRSDIVVHSYGGVAVRELMIEEVTSGRMPLSPVTIGADEKATLLAWLHAGAPAEPNVTCDGGVTVVGEADADAEAETEDAE